MVHSADTATSPNSSSSSFTAPSSESVAGASSDPALAPSPSDECVGNRHGLQDLKPEEDVPPPSMYFGGCGFGCAYFVGVHRAMVERWGPDFYKHTVLAGGSAGAIMAIQVALGRTNEQMDELYKGIAAEASKRGVILEASACLMEAVQNVFDEIPGNQAHAQLSRRNCYGVTHFPFEHKFHSSWEDDNDLIDCLTASCHIPLYSRRATKKYSLLVDGAYGFTGSSLRELHENDTLFVGIDPTADVGRSLTFSQMVRSCVFPPSLVCVLCNSVVVQLYPLTGKDYEEVVESGYQDMKAWHRHRKADKVGRRIPNYPVLVIIWLLRCVHNIVDVVLYVLWPLIYFYQLITVSMSVSRE
jgi:hypothetical protein